MHRHCMLTFENLCLLSLFLHQGRKLGHVPHAKGFEGKGKCDGFLQREAEVHQR